jgi:competence protein ComEC
VRLRCLFPPRGWQSGTADDKCAVFLLECRGTRVLLMNDAGFIAEKALLESGGDLRADVLVKGLHSSDYSGLPEFLNAVRPRAVIFTNTNFPEDEHVSDEWRGMAAGKGAQLFDQSRTGAVIIRIERGHTVVRGWYDGTELEWERVP